MHVYEQTEQRSEKKGAKHTYHQQREREQTEEQEREREREREWFMYEAVLLKNRIPFTKIYTQRHIENVCKLARQKIDPTFNAL